MISVVLPTYNGEKYLKQSIDSIQWQTYQDWELIVVDDCSSDRTGEIAEEYAKKDDRIIVVHNSHNCKLPASLNIGFGMAKGQYYTWTSDDNAYSKDAFEQMLFSLKQTNADFVFADMEAIDSEDYVIFPMKSGPVDDLPIKNTIGACFLYRSQLHTLLNGYDVSRFLVEDYDFWLRVYWKYRMYHIDKCLYYYRIHGGSLSAQKKKAIDKAVVKLLMENVKYIQDSEREEKVMERIKRLK